MTPRPALALAMALAATALVPALATPGSEPSTGYERPAAIDAPGPHSLPVDLALLTGSTPFQVERVPGRPAAAPRPVARGGLRDLRLFDARGRELPYLLVESPPREPEWRPAQALTPIPASKRESGFEGDLGSVRTLDRVRFGGLPAPFLKKLALDGSGDRQRWVRLSTAATVFDLPDSGLRQLELEFAPGAFRYLRVTWDDSSSARVPIPARVAARLVRPELPPRSSAPIAVVFERRPSEPGTSRFRLRLPAPALPLVALRLGVGGAHLLRRARVSEARLADDCALPVLLGEVTLRRTVRDGLVAEDLRIPLSAPATAQLELEVDDGDNPPLDLRSVEVEPAELPWIYLEVEEAQTIVARWGDARKDVPRYDLEAARARVARALPPPAAHWGAVATASPAALPPATAPSTGPRIDTAGFRYVRSLAAARPGLAVVPLDAAVLAHSVGGRTGDFRDLRVVDAAGRQIPYLVERRAEPLLVKLPPLRPEAASRLGPGDSFYRVPLPYPELPPSRLVLRTSARVFERRIELLVGAPAAHERRRRPAADVAASALWRNTEPDTPASALTLDLPTLATSEVLLLVREGDNLALPLGAPELLLPSYQIRFFGTSMEAIRLFYGDERLVRPRYDLALLGPTVLASPAEETALEAERTTPKGEHVVLAPRAFWAVIVAAAVTLLLVIARLVRRATAHE